VTSGQPLPAWSLSVGPAGPQPAEDRGSLRQRAAYQPQPGEVAAQGALIRSPAQLSTQDPPHPGGGARGFSRLRATVRSSTSTDTPVAFRAAIKEHFAQIVRADGRYPLHELQRQFAYDRALARLFSSDHADRWVLKGAGALLARLATARHSKDIDVLFEVSTSPNGSRCPTRSAGVAATRASPRRRPVSLLTTRRPSRSLAFCLIRHGDIVELDIAVIVDGRIRFLA
jgi:hypothetical protein